MAVIALQSQPVWIVLRIKRKETDYECIIYD